MDHKDYQASRTKVRPSIGDLQNDDFMEKLAMESEKLRSDHAFTYTRPLPDVSVSESSRATGSGPNPKKPAVKKSRFAMEREAELEATRQEADSDPSHLAQPVPIGRFELDLSEDKLVGHNALPTGPQVFQAGSNGSTQDTRKSLLGEIVERDEMLTEQPNNDFASKYEPSGFPNAGPSERLSTHVPRSPSPEEREFLWNQTTPELGPHSRSSTERSSDSELLVQTKTQISTENNTTLAKMSESEILTAQAEIKAMLMSSNPALLDKLLNKNNAQPSCVQTVCKDSRNLIDSDEMNYVQKKPLKRVQFSEDVVTSPPAASSYPKSEHRCLEKLATDATGDSRSPSVPGTKQKCLHEEIQPLPQARTFMFDLSGRMLRAILDDDASTLPSSQSFCDKIHPQQAEAFTLKQLFELIMSSVPSQRVIGFKIMTRITDRHLVAQPEDADDEEFNIFVSTELQPAISDMVLAASHTLGEKNVGLADSASMLLNSISCGLLETRNHNSKFSPASELGWIQDLFTKVDILSNIQSHFRYQSLPKVSLVAMVRSLSAIIQLSEGTRVSEEITKRPMFLEELIQVLVSVPWPPVTNTKIELPCLDCLHLLQTLAQSSRLCSQALVDRGLLTPTFRFLALPYWSSLHPDLTLMMTRFMCEQFRIISTFAAYGLGTSLRTALDPLLRSLTSSLQTRLLDVLEREKGNAGSPAAQSIEELKLISAYLNTLKSWMQCANDPHMIEPPHSINWSQVIEWSSDGVEFISLCLREQDFLDVSPDHRLDDLTNDVLASACDLLEQYLSGCSRKNIETSQIVDQLSGFGVHLYARLHQATTRIFSIASDQDSFTLSARCLRDAHLITSLARLSLRIQQMGFGSSTDHPFALHLNKSSSPTDQEFATVCRLAFKHHELSTLPSSLCSLYIQLDTRMCDWVWAASLLLRNSDGDVVLSSIQTVLELYKQKFDAHELGGLNNHLPVSSGAEQLSTSDVKLLWPLYEAYLNETSIHTLISYPSPQQIQNLMKQTEQPAFVLSSTWPLLAVNFLTKSYLKSLINDTGSTPAGLLTRLIRATVSLATTVQDVLLHIQTQASPLALVCKDVLSDGMSVWMALLKMVVVVSSQAAWEIDGQQENILGIGSIFEDEVTCRLIARFVSPFQLQSRVSNATSPVSNPKLDTARTGPFTKEDEMELYSILTDILGIYDSSSFGNHTFSMLLIPFFDMRHSIDFRRLLFRDYAHILTHLKVGFMDVMVLDKNELELECYLYPLETNEDMILLFGQMLSIKSNLERDEQPFLYFYLLHHVTSYLCLRWESLFEEKEKAKERLELWNKKDKEEEFKIQIRLFKLILSECDDEVYQDVLKYQKKIDKKKRSI
ncbi:hypothetical protein CROQUDRAFT_71224 [Cronartium quercuum f. sp. fusiforme G11]|uniref:RNA polymerase II-associated protein 1 C-terminal domain-containing protein n=1 Tax=Cronartium quercuum f. sp. fusiforme G11 TaxID=708437 RepID=A0A9P6NYU2_9BASI|nr:hypothetical protein CROQUDRAFT_71224 [Cronartium quercuum f. sp. fusiforme G11]